MYECVLLSLKSSLTVNLSRCPFFRNIRNSLFQVHFTQPHYKCIVKSPKDFKDKSDFEAFLQQNSVDVLIAIHAVHCTNLLSGKSVFQSLVFTVRKPSLRRLCFYTCLSFCSQERGVSRPRLRGRLGGLPGGCLGPGPEGGWGLPGPRPGRGLPGPGRDGGVSRPRPRGVYPSMHWGNPPTTSRPPPTLKPIHIERKRKFFLDKKAK